MLIQIILILDEYYLLLFDYLWQSQTCNSLVSGNSYTPVKLQLCGVIVGDNDGDIVESVGVTDGLAVGCVVGGSVDVNGDTDGISIGNIEGDRDGFNVGD
eukprot:CAMPEP_0114690286 /NCGR_PEP_ID=MMETSP0191-20121206/65526_1 /TAXON_ID=126664 /ORGANISM="Sorites sp." /LENGTH=99 /DNA_ID=CAMNT_0001980017 /DNA_START=559 /DNA_END=855 /DNA_ORIENTATION=+